MSASNRVTYPKSPGSVQTGASQGANSSSPPCTEFVPTIAPQQQQSTTVVAAGGVTSTISAYRSARSALSSAVPMKLFAAWEVEKTPSNCIPRLCTLTITKLSLNRQFATQVHSLAIATKMQSSKRTLRSNEVDLSLYLQSPKQQEAKQESASSSPNQSRDMDAQQDSNERNVSCSMNSTTFTFPGNSDQQHHTQVPRAAGEVSSGEAQANHRPSSNSNMITVDSSSTSHTDDYISIDLDLTFALQYPHFLKKNDNKLQILLQRRKRYKNRAMLGFKTLAGGIIDLTEVLQRSQLTNKLLQLRENTKDLRKATVVAQLMITSLRSSPVDACDVADGNGVPRIQGALTVPRPASSFKSYSSRLKRLNLKSWPSSSHQDDTSTVFHLHDSAELDSDEDEYFPSEESDSEVAIDTVARAMMSHVDYNRRLSNKQQAETSVIAEPSVVDEAYSPCKHHHTNRFSSSRLPKWRRSTDKSSSIHSTDHCSNQRNFKQKFFSLLKKFRITDSEASDSEEGDSRNKVPSKRDKASKLASAQGLLLDRIEDLELELEDTDIDSINGDLDDISITSIPRPGLKPFFSSKSTLVEDSSFAEAALISSANTTHGAHGHKAATAAAAAAAGKSTHQPSGKSTTNTVFSHG